MDLRKFLVATRFINTGSLRVTGCGRSVHRPGQFPVQRDCEQSQRRHRGKDPLFGGDLLVDL
jgi:hypothetical protein